MPSSITVSESDVQDALGDPDASVSFEASEAELLVNGELVPHAGSDEHVQERLAKTGALIAAAAAHDGGNGPLSSITQGTAQISYATDSEDAMSFWQRAVQMDPTGRLASSGDKRASIAASDVRGGR